MQSQSTPCWCFLSKSLPSPPTIRRSQSHCSNKDANVFQHYCDESFWVQKMSSFIVTERFIIAGCCPLKPLLLQNGILTLNLASHSIYMNKNHDPGLFRLLPHSPYIYYRMTPPNAPQNCTCCWHSCTSHQEPTLILLLQRITGSVLTRPENTSVQNTATNQHILRDAFVTLASRQPSWRGSLRRQKLVFFL